MSAMRQDPSHGSGPAVWSRVRTAGDQPGREAGSLLSVVVPAKNEAASLPQLVAEIAAALRPLSGSRREGHRLDGFEIVIVDDGSTDETAAVLRQLAPAYPELRPLSLVSNVGQSAATAAGFRAARGDWVATLDADLQNDPADLAALWAALPGHDAALGWRNKREDVWSKRVISLLGESGPQPGARPVDPRHRLLGPDLLSRDGPATADVPGLSSLLRPVASPRGVPDRPVAGEPPPQAARPVALQPLESLAPGDRRSLRRRLADAPAHVL